MSKKKKKALQKKELPALQRSPQNDTVEPYPSQASLRLREDSQPKNPTQGKKEPTDLEKGRNTFLDERKKTGGMINQEVPRNRGGHPGTMTGGCPEKIREIKPKKRSQLSRKPAYKKKWVAIRRSNRRKKKGYRRKGETSVTGSLGKCIRGE